ncbi:MAG TPA: dihydropteroate synthase [Candidatus Acidoferrales bacterium]|nr:dihydropteroate synthase [Candidatus Acidoferrales bacterium]
MLIIGELINCTRKKAGEAAQRRDAEFFRDLARKQASAGAHMLDVNGDLPDQEGEVLSWLADLVQGTVDLPLCLDSADAKALTTVLPLCKRRPMINSLSDEPTRWTMLPILKEHRPKVIALCTSESGVPTEVDDRLATASRLIDRLTAEGFALDDIYVDPCVLPVAAGPHGPSLLEAVTKIAEAYPGVHISAGVSNVSFGLPLRKLLNESFLLLLMSRGLDTAIVDPCDQQLMMNIMVAEALLGKDERCRRYLRAYREGKLVPTDSSREVAPKVP